jgi:hypothetical protein
LNGINILTWALLYEMADKANFLQEQKLRFLEERCRAAQLAHFFPNPPARTPGTVLSDEERRQDASYAEIMNKWFDEKERLSKDFDNVSPFIAS